MLLVLQLLRRSVRIECKSSRVVFDVRSANVTCATIGSRRMSDTVATQIDEVNHLVEISQVSSAKMERLGNPPSFKTPARSCASLVHEINNPLAVSLLSAQL